MAPDGVPDVSDTTMVDEEGRIVPLSQRHWLPLFSQAGRPGTRHRPSLSFLERLGMSATGSAAAIAVSGVAAALAAVPQFSFM